MRVMHREGYILYTFVCCRDGSRTYFLYAYESLHVGCAPLHWRQYFQLYVTACDYAGRSARGLMKVEFEKLSGFASRACVACHDNFWVSITCLVPKYFSSWAFLHEIHEIFIFQCSVLMFRTTLFQRAGSIKKRQIRTKTRESIDTAICILHNRHEIHTITTGLYIMDNFSIHIAFRAPVLLLSLRRNYTRDSDDKPRWARATTSYIYNIFIRPRHTDP